jgi:phosphate-selective porin OprO/OprP
LSGAPTVPPAPGAPVAEDTAVPGADLPEGTEAPPSGGGDNFPVWASYRYNPGGGYLHFGDPNDEYTVNFQEQVTLDGTFYNRANVATTEKGFNIPFYRAFAFGNITKDWNYQASVQAFLGSFNILDLWLDHQFCDAVHFRFGRMLTPFLYEYYGFSPAWEPVITNSPLFQVAGKRQLGGMFWGKLFENRAQYQAGVFNGTAGSFFDTNNSVDFIGAFDVTPFKGSGNQMLDSLGGGIGVQTGRQNALLSAGSGLNFINGAGEPTLNPSFIGSTGLPFLVYNPDVAMNGMQTKVAPHLYWFGQFSVLAEYVYMDRTLTSIAVPKGISIVQGYYVNTSYFLTGERYSGDGLGGYTVISPLRPFIPSKGIYGPGAWELAAQFSQLHVGSSDFANGFVSPVFRASQLSQLMLGVNWWMNKYTRVSFDWVNARTNAAVPLAPGAVPTNQYNIFWTRLAMFF